MSTARRLVEREPLGLAPDGARFERFRLHGRGGVAVELLSWGATLAGFRYPDRAGRLADLVLGFDRPAGWLGPHPYMGSSVGRFANRIAHGRLRLEGREVALTRNEGEHHLHGGLGGVSRRSWEAEVADREEAAAVAFRCTSPDGEDGYPGRLELEVRYTLALDGVLRIDFLAVTDRVTVVNLTNHAYWNLCDGGASSIEHHRLRIDADHFAPIDARGIPTGEIAPVLGTPLDFSQERAIGERLGAVVALRGGYDHAYLLNPGGLEREAARLHDPVSGRTLRVYTTQVGLQLYTGNQLDSGIVGRGGVPYGRWRALCLETQALPDAPNQPSFPSTLLRPGEEYRQSTIYALSLEESRER